MLQKEKGEREKKNCRAHPICINLKNQITRVPQSPRFISIYIRYNAVSQIVILRENWWF